MTVILFITNHNLQYLLLLFAADQNVDDLPVISDLDIEEFIESIQDNQDPNADKVKEFNVDSLLNDPYTL